MSKIKKYLVDGKKKMDKQEFKAALSDLDVALMLDSKSFQALLMSGLCHEKLENYDKAKEQYQYARELKEDDPIVNKQLYSLHNQLEEYDEASQYIENIVQGLSGKADKVKQYEEYLLKLIEVYEKGEDQENVHSNLVQVLKRADVSQITKITVAKSYYNLVLESGGLNENSYGFLSENFQDIPEGQYVDEILGSILSHISVKYSIQEKVDIVFEHVHLLNTSAVALEAQLDYYGYYATKNIKIMEYIARKALDFLIHQHYPQIQDKFYLQSLFKSQKYEDNDFQRDIKERLIPKCQIFLYAYQKMLQSENSNSFNVEMTKLLFEECGLEKIEIPRFDENQEKIRQFSQYIWTFIYQISNAINKQDYQTANKFLGQFLNTINNQQESADIRFFEDLHTKIGLQVFDDLDSLLQVKVICKIRLHTDFSNLPMLKCYYDCMLKLIRNFQHYDPEVPMNKVIDEILNLEPENKYFQGELIWLNFSQLSLEEQKNQLDQTIEHLQKLFDNSQGQSLVQAKIYKRIGTLKFVFNQYIELSEILTYYSKSLELNPKDYQIHKCLGIIYKIQNKQEEALEQFQSAFVNYSYDIHVNKCLFYQLNSLGMQEDALDFVERIEPGFQKIFWVNYVLALCNINRQNYTDAEKFMSNSVQLFQSDERRTLKNYFEKYIQIQDDEQFGIPHLLEQNNIQFLDDYPIFSDVYWTNNAVVLQNSYPKIQSKQKLYKMYIQQSQIQRMEGMIGSALSSIKEAQEVLYEAHYEENFGNEIYKFTNEPTYPLSIRILDTLQVFEKAFIKSDILNLSELDLKGFDIEGVVLQLEYAQVLFYSQDYFHACQRLRYSLLLCIYLIEIYSQKDQQGEDDEEVSSGDGNEDKYKLKQVEDIYYRILSLIFEIGNSQVMKTWQKQNIAQGLAIYNQYSMLEIPQCENIMDFAIVSEFYLLGFMLTQDKEQIIYCLGHLESGLKCLNIDVSQLNLQDKENLRKINQNLNNMSQRHQNAVVALLADLIFANFKLFEISQEKDRYESAIMLSKVGMLLFSDNCMFYNYYGLLVQDQGQKIGAFIKSIQVDGQNNVAIDNMAEIFFQNQYYQESIQLYLKSMELKPGNVKACIGVIAITLIQGIDYVRVFNKNFENSMKQFTYFKTIQDFFIEKCKSYLEFVQEFESSETALLLNSVLEVLEYNNYQNIKFSQVQQPQQLEYQQKNQDILLNILNLQLIGRSNTQIKKLDLKKVFDDKISKFLNFSDHDQKLIKLQLENTFSNTEIYSQLYETLLEKIFLENKTLVEQMNEANNISSEKDHVENSKNNHHYLISQLYNHLMNLQQLFVLGTLAKKQNTHEEFKSLCANISTASCDILFKNSQRFCNMYQAQLDLALWNYLYLCQIYEQDKNEINQEVQLALIILSNSRYQQFAQPAWVFFQFDLDIEDLEIINMGDYYYLQGIHAHKSQNQKLVKKKLFGSILNDPSNHENREALNTYTVTIERKAVSLDYLNFTTSSQYEKRILNFVNSDDVSLKQKISQLGKGCMYLNKPHLWYLYVHYSFEDQTKYSKGFFYYMYQLLRTKVIDKLVKYDEFHNGVKKRGVKLLSEVYWRYKLNYPEEDSQKFQEIREYLEKHQHCIPDFSHFENSMIIFLNKNGADLKELESLIQQKQDFSVLKLLFEICRKLFMTRKGKDLLDLLKQMRELIMDFEEQLSTRTSLKKLYNMIQYIDSFIYLTAIAELFDENSEIDQVDILEIVQEASENCQSYQNQSVNMIFLYLQYCYQNSIIDEMDKYLEMFSKFSSIVSRKDNLISGYFDLILKFHYIVDIQEDDIQESIDEFNTYTTYMRDEFYLELNSSVKSLFHYLQGMIKLKSAELVPQEDKNSLMKDFKLAILYRPDFGKQIIKHFV